MADTWHQQPQADWMISFEEGGASILEIDLPADGSLNFELAQDGASFFLIEVAEPGDGLTIEDSGSGKIVLLNDERLLGRMPLRDGDRIGLLSRTLRVGVRRLPAGDRINDAGRGGPFANLARAWLPALAALLAVLGILAVWFWRGDWPDFPRKSPASSAKPSPASAAASHTTNNTAEPPGSIGLRGSAPEILAPVTGREPWSGELWRSDLGSAVGCVAIAADGSIACAGTADGGIILFAPSDGSLVASLELHAASVSSVALAADGSRLLAGSYDGNASLWDVSARKPLMNLGAHTAPVRSVAMTPDARRGLTADIDGMIIYWNLETGADIRLLLGHTGPVNSLAFSPDAALAVSAGMDGRVIMWDLAAGTRRHEMVFESGANSATFSPDGALLAVALDGFLPATDGIQPVDGMTLRVFNARDASPLDLMTTAGDWMVSLAFSPDGNILAGTTGGNPDPRIAQSPTPFLLKLWDTRTGMVVKRLDRHAALVTGVVFLPDGRSAITSSLDHTLRRW